MVNREKKQSAEWSLFFAGKLGERGNLGGDGKTKGIAKKPASL